MHERGWLKGGKKLSSHLKQWTANWMKLALKYTRYNQFALKADTMKEIIGVQGWTEDARSKNLTNFISGI